MSEEIKRFDKILYKKYVFFIQLLSFRKNNGKNEIPTNPGFHLINIKRKILAGYL